MGWLRVQGFGLRFSSVVPVRLGTWLALRVSPLGLGLPRYASPNSMFGDKFALRVLHSTPQAPEYLILHAGTQTQS